MMICSKSGDTGTWEEVPRGPCTDDDPFDDPTNTGIHTMEEINGVLVVGTEKATHDPDAGDPELWMFDGTKWMRVEGEIEDFTISEIFGMQDPIFGDIATIQDANFAPPYPKVFEQPYFGNWDVEGYNLYTVRPGKEFNDNGDPVPAEFNVPIQPIPPDVVDITPTHVRYVGRGPNLDAGEISDYIVGDPDANGRYDAADFGDVSPFGDHGIVKLFQFDPNPRDEDPGYLYFGTADLHDGATLMRSKIRMIRRAGS